MLWQSFSVVSHYRCAVLLFEARGMNSKQTGQKWSRKLHVLNLKPHAWNSRTREANTKRRNHPGVHKPLKDTQWAITQKFSPDPSVLMKFVPRLNTWRVNPFKNTHRKRPRRRPSGPITGQMGGALSGFCLPSLVPLCLAWGDVSRRHTETNAKSAVN